MQNTESLLAADLGISPWKFEDSGTFIAQNFLTISEEISKAKKHCTIYAENFSLEASNVKPSSKGMD